MQYNKNNFVSKNKNNRDIDKILIKKIEIFKTLKWFK